MPITVYTKSTCAPCKTLKMWLNNKNVSFEERNVEDPAIFTEMVEKTGLMSVPQTIISGRVVSGPHFSLLNQLISVDK